MRSDEEAGSIVLHVSSDTNEKEKGEEEAEDSSRREETHPKKRNSV